MALYVAICLLAALATLDGVPVVRGNVFVLVWGTTLGLALAHLFAFRIAGRVIEQGQWSTEIRAASAAQLAGAAAVAVLVSVVIVVVPTDVELDAARYTLSGLIGAVGYGVARNASRSRLRAALFALGVVAVATAVAVLKNRLIGH